MTTPTYPLTLTPNVAGAVAQQLNDHDPFYVVDGGLELPTAAYDEEYAESAYTEGGRRTRSRAQNSEGKLSLRTRAGLDFFNLGGGDGIYEYVTRLEQTVEACRVHGGVLTWIEALYYDLESISIATVNYDEFQFNRLAIELSFTCRPYARMAPVSIVTNATSSDPIQSIELPDIPGSAPALVEVTVADTAAQSRDHLEVGLDADYDPATRTNLVTNPSFETSTTGWSTSVPAYHINSGATLTRETPVIAQSGAYVGQIVTPGSAAAEGVAYAFSGYTFLAGTAYTLSMRVMASGVATDLDLVFGKASADNAATNVSLLTLQSWTDLSVTWTPAADGTAVYAILRTDLGGSPQARTIQIDKVMVEAASTAGVYFDGRVGGRWTGAADASTSVLDRPLLVDSASLAITELAGSTTTRTGAYSSSGVIRATLGPDALAICQTGVANKGRHRVKLRVYGTGSGSVKGPIYVRIAYRVGSGSWSKNSWARVPGMDAFYEVDCGLVQGVDEGSLSIRVEAYSATATFTDTLDVDYLMLIPAYRWAKSRGSVDTTATTYGGRDTFSRSGNLDSTAKTADVGGDWAEPNTAADAADGLVCESSGGTAQRTFKPDASLTAGCMATLGSVVGGCSVQATVKFSAKPTRPSYPNSCLSFGVLARYSNTTSWVALVIRDKWVDTAAPYAYGEGFSSYGYQLAVVAADGSTLSETTLSDYFAVTGVPISLQLEIDTAGSYVASWQGVQLLTGNDARLAAGGSLDDGKCGLYDAYTGATACTRNYDNYRQTGMSVSHSYQHVVDASGAVILGDDSIARADGTRPPSFEGSYLTVPPAGREDRTHRLAVKMRRSDVDTAPDANIADSQRVSVRVTPRVILL